jgi:hypothetical protein
MIKKKEKKEIRIVFGNKWILLTLEVERNVAGGQFHETHPGSKEQLPTNGVYSIAAAGLQG